MKTHKLLMFALVILLASCNKDFIKENSEELQSSIEKISNENNQFKNLKTPEILINNFPKDKKVAVASTNTATSTNNDGCKLISHTQTSSFDKLNIIDPTANILYLGSLIDAKSINTGLYTPVFMPSDYVRKPITFSTSIIGLPTNQVKKTIIPTLSNFTVAMSEIQNSNIQGEQPAYFTFELKKVQSKSQLETSLQTNLNIGPWASITANLTDNKMSEKTYFAVKIFQKFFSASLDIPTDGNLFNKPATYPSNVSPVYISSIDYGRSAMLLFESSFDSTRVSQFLNSTINIWKVGGSVTYTNEQKQILNELSVSGTIIGGSSSEAAKTIDGMDMFTNFVKSSANLTPKSRGAIISYTLRNANNHSINKISFASTYYTKVCDNIIAAQPLAWQKLWNSNYNGTVNDIKPISSSLKIFPSNETPALTTNGKNTLFSPSGNHKITIQTDGNLVVYQTSNNKPLWASNSDIKRTPTVNDRFGVVFQLDGNLVIYKLDVNNKIIGFHWAANTSFVPFSDPYFNNIKYGSWVMQDDGNFVLYFPSSSKPGYHNAICATGSDKRVSSHFGKIK